MNASNPKPSPRIGSTILGNIHGTLSGLTEIITTSPVEWNTSLQRYYVSGYKRMRSNGRISKNELRFCLIDFEVFHLGQTFRDGCMYEENVK